MYIDNLTMNFGITPIFDDINIQIKDNEKVGVIGVNGAGKTTLFNIILGKLEPTNGKIRLKNGTRIAFLPQVISDEIPNMDITVLEFLLTGRPIAKLEKELEDLYLKSSTTADEKQVNFLMKKIGQVQEQLYYYDVYEAENILLKIISGMNIDDSLLDMKLSNLSGGQKSKIAFARLLYSKPEILLLDEPTNHMDQSSRNYIINYLKNYQGMILVISHDIEFLDEVTNSTLYLNKVTHKMELFPGNYHKYLKIKQMREESLSKLLEKQEREEEKLKKIIAKYIKGTEKQANIAKDRQKKLARLEKDKVVIEKRQKTTIFKMQINKPSGLIPLKVDNVTFGYDENKPLFKNLTFDLSRGEKFLIVGENGVGKSTLLKLIMNYLKPITGEININFKTEIGYYAQEHELLDLNKNIIENFKYSGLTEPRLRSLLGSFMFYGDDIYKKISILSPGERSRVALAKLAVTGANFLILDEPTNHLDPDTQKIIADTFSSFEGTMLVVSHNIEFTENLGIKRMLMLPSGEIKYYDKETVLYYQKINSTKK